MVSKKQPIVEEDKIIVIAGNDNEKCVHCQTPTNIPKTVIYLWAIVLTLQHKNRIRLHMRPHNLSHGKHLADLLCSLGMEIRETKEVQTINTKTNQKLDVIEMTLEKIPAIKK